MKTQKPSRNFRNHRNLRPQLPAAQRRGIAALGAAALLLLGLHSAQAGNTYVDTGSSGSMATGFTNGGTAIPTNGTLLTDTLTFNNTGTQSDDLTAAQVLNALVLNFGNASALTLNGTAGTNSTINLASGATISLNNAAGATGLVTDNLNTTLAGATTFAGTGSATFGGILSGAGSLIQSGTGTLTLGGTNTYTGTTTVNSGILSISKDANLGTAPGAATANSLTLNGGTLQVTGTTANNAGGTIVANRGITLGAAGGTINVASLDSGDIGGTVNDVNYSGQITGSGNLTISGGAAVNSGAQNGTYLFELKSTSSNYSGSTTINNAGLFLNGGDNVSNFLPVTTVLNLTNHAIVGIGGLTNQTIAGLSGDNTSIIASTNNGSNNILTLNTAAGTSYTYAGVIGAPSNGSPLLYNKGTNKQRTNLIKTGAGTEILSGANTFTGGLTVNNGTLDVTGTIANIAGNSSSLLGTTTFAAGAVVNGGVLKADYTGTTTGNIFDPGNALTLNGGTFNVNGSASATRTQTLASLTLGVGGGLVSVTNNGAAATNLTFTSGTITQAGRRPGKLCGPHRNQYHADGQQLQCLHWAVGFLQ